MAVTTSEGFVKVQFNGTWMGQNTQNAFYYGFPSDAEVDSFEVASDFAVGIRDALEDNVAGLPGIASWRLPFGATYVLTGLDVWVKGITGVELAVLPTALSISGARAVEGDKLPPNLTASAYAPSQRYAQRGAKLGFSGGLENDQNADGWLDSPTLFKPLVQTFCDSMYADGGWEIPAIATTLIPVVVPRIRSGTFGIYEYRLPIEAADVPTTVPISPWSVGQGIGTANSRKRAIR